jgi:hypothetical protein
VHTPTHTHTTTTATRFVVFVFAAVLAAVVWADASLREEYERWADAHGRAGADRGDFRFGVWLAEKYKIDQLNSPAGSSGEATYALNAFSDRTPEEKQGLLGLSLLPPQQRQNTRAMRAPQRPTSSTAPRSVPTDWNWCEHGVCGDIRDQGYCGSCWCFAAIGALESQAAIARGSFVALSEQQAIDCNIQRYGTGCCGGLSKYVFEDIKDYAAATSYGPYLDYNHPATSPACSQNLHPCKAVPTVVKVHGYEEPELMTHEQWAQYVYENGPTSTAFSVEDRFYAYASGVYACN